MCEDGKGRAVRKWKEWIRDKGGVWRVWTQ